MAELPTATTTIDDSAGSFAGATGYAIVLAAVSTSADATPRVFGSVTDLIAQHKYSPGASYVASHIKETNKPVLFVGLPIVTPGAVGRINSSGVAGTSAISIAAGADGILEETDGKLTVITGGTIGTAGIIAELSLDGGPLAGGSKAKRIRLGEASQYVVPHLGITINFGAGTLIAGDVYTFATTAPKYDAAGLEAARAALADQLKLARSMIAIAELDDSNDADDLTTMINGYETENQRFAYVRAQVRDRLPLATLSHVVKRMTGSPTLTFAEVGVSGDTVTRSAGSWITDGFAVGDVVTIAGSAGNNVTGPIASLTATVLTFGTTDLAAEGPVSNCTVVGSPGLTFAEVGGTGDTITRTAGSWLSDGFRVGDTVTITGSGSNNVSGAIAALSATVLTFGTTDLAAEVIGSSAVTITKGETMTAWVSAMDAEFASVAAQKRIDISIGRGRKTCPITGWKFRRPAMWGFSIREYQHDLHIPTFKKRLGPLDEFSLLDGENTIVEYDDRKYKTASAAGFSSFRTWANGPNGTFPSLSLTRATEGSLLSRTHNLAVANLVCTVVQSASEDAIGETPALNDDGTAKEAAIRDIEASVNKRIESEVLAPGLEGSRASSAVWHASRTDILNVPGAELTGYVDLQLNGTIERIRTVIRVQSAGA